MRRFLLPVLLFHGDPAHAQIAAPEPEHSFFARYVEDHTLLIVVAVIILLFVVGAVAFHIGRNTRE
jgi:hypothetical protein